MSVKVSFLLLMLVGRSIAPLTTLPRTVFLKPQVRRAQDSGEEAYAEPLESPESSEEVYATSELEGAPEEGAYEDEEGAYQEEEVLPEGEEGEIADGEYYEPDYSEPEEPEPTLDQEFDTDFESEEIKETLAMVEYKMAEVNELMKECIEQEFAADLMADRDQVMTECVGLTYQILFFNYQESMRRVKQIFMELLKEKLSHLSEQYLDETEFFLDLLEDLVDKDYMIRESLEISKSTSKYYVSPRFFDSLIDIAAPEIDAFTQLHTRLRESRSEIQNLMDEKLREREKYLESLKGEVDKLEATIEPEYEEEPFPEEEEEIYEGDIDDDGEELEEEEYEEPEEEEYEDEEEEPYEDEELEHEPLEEGEDDMEEGGEGEESQEGGEEGEEAAGGSEEGEEASSGEGEGEERLKRRRMMVRKTRNPYAARGAVMRRRQRRGYKKVL